MSGGGGSPLKHGDLVEVRSASEILATLDQTASLGGMPFMPEMLRYVGKRFTVSRRVEKICATAGGASPSRRMHSTVLLEDLRCDGSGHDGCQLSCRLYWREEWLRRINGERDQAERAEGHEAGSVADSTALEALAAMATKTVRELNGGLVEAYRCQATEAVVASEPLGKYDIRQFARELAARNVTPPHLVRVVGRAVWLRLLRLLKLRELLALPEPRVPNDEATTLRLRRGDLVRVRPPEEIAATLDDGGKTRGLTFDPEMVPYCGGTYRVKDRVERFIEDKTGQMVTLSSDCLILDGVACTGEHSISSYLFCPRGTHPFWREAWLKRVEGESGQPEAGVEQSLSE